MILGNLARFIEGILGPNNLSWIHNIEFFEEFLFQMCDIFLAKFK
jgi:hypothetical protein